VNIEQSIRATLSPRLRNVVEDFQQYIQAEYRVRSSRWQYAKSYIQRIAEEISSVITCQEEPAADLISVASLLNVSLEPIKGTKTNTLPDGQLAPTENGFRVRLYSPTWPEISARERFTIAHEFGHIFFYSISSARPERIIPACLGRTPHESRREEGLCDSFASALLVPNYWASSVAARKLKMGGVISNSEQLQVSPEVLIRRVLYDLDGWRESVIYSVWLKGDEVIVRIFRGSSRKAAVDAPTGVTVSRLLEGCSLEQALNKLGENESFHNADIHVLSPAFFYVKI
jgi:hypothetical protein